MPVTEGKLPDTLKFFSIKLENVVFLHHPIVWLEQKKTFQSNPSIYKSQVVTSSQKFST